MKNITYFLFTLIICVVLTSCSENQSDTIKNSQSDEQNLFASKTFEIFEELTTVYFPAEDVKFIVFKDSKGVSSAKFELIGKSKLEVQMGSFVSKSNSLDDGTTCDGKFSCGKAIYNCLENGKDALISVGACELSAKEYCVKCQNPK